MFAALFAVVAANAWTVKFTNPDGWATPYVWAWDDSANYTGGTWPGKPMTKSGDVWTYTGEGTPAKIIFSNNGNPQTSDLPFVDGATYNKTGPVGAATTTYTCYYDNSLSNWAEVYAYAYGGYTNAWPGEKLTKGANGLYEFTFEMVGSAEGTKLVFNKGEGGTVGDVQTADFVFVEGATYNLNGNVEDGGNTDEPFAIYFNNTVGWETPYVHYWGASESSWPGVAMTKYKDNIWTYTLPAGTTGILFNAGDGDATKTSDFIPVPDHVYTTSGDQGLYDGGSGDDPVIPTEKEVYLTGGALGWNAAGIKMNHEEGTNVYTIETREVFTDEWKITDGTWAWSFGMGDSLDVNVANDCWFDGQNFSAIDLAADQNVVLTFTLVQGSDVKDSPIPSTVLYTIKSGIESIEAENGPVQYFNLQGVRVANPENGIFIRVQNGKAVKIVK